MKKITLTLCAALLAAFSVLAQKGIPNQEPSTLKLNAKQAAAEYIKNTYRDGWSMNV